MLTLALAQASTVHSAVFTLEATEHRAISRGSWQHETLKEKLTRAVSRFPVTPCPLAKHINNS